MSSLIRQSACKIMQRVALKISFLRYIIRTGLFITITWLGATGTAWGFGSYPEANVFKQGTLLGCGEVFLNLRFEAGVRVERSSLGGTFIGLASQSTTNQVLIGAGRLKEDAQTSSYNSASTSRILRVSEGCFVETPSVDVFIDGTDYTDTSALRITLTGHLKPGVYGIGDFAGIPSNTIVTITTEVTGGVNGLANPAVTWSAENTAPTAVAVAAQASVNEAAQVTLDGSGSSDTDGDALTYAWTQTAGTSVTLSSGTAASPSFTAPTLTSNGSEVLTFSLVVNDGTVASAADTVSITVSNVNEAPVANAGPDQSALTAEFVATLDGMGSTDADGDDLTYAWIQTAGPGVILSDPTAVSPTFTVPGVATDMVLSFSLVVNDGTVDSMVDEVSLSVLESTAPTVEITGVPETTNAPFTASFAFSEAVSGFTLSDLVLGNASASEFNGSDTVFTALITPLGNGASTLDIPAGVAQDAAGNSNTAAVQVSTSFDTSAPTVVLSGVPESVRGPFELTITFDEAVTGLTLAGLTLENAAASNLIAVSDQVYTTNIRPSANGLVSMNIAAGAAQDVAGNPNQASNTLTTNFIDENLVRTRTTGIINNFIARRADQITLNDPDLAGRLLEQGTDGHLDGHAERHYTQLAFNAKANGEDAQLGKLFGADAAAKINMWVEASFISISAETAENDLGLVHAGVDYRISDDTLIGVMGQYDWADEADNVEDFHISGNGWLAGPYVVSRITDNLIFDGRAAYGQSDNTVSPFSAYEDDFDTDRYLLKGQATGDFTLNEWLINPSLSVIYYEETQKAYMDSLNIDIPEQTINLGRLTFGPRASKTFKTSSGNSITPSFGLRGVWDFEQADIVDLSTGFASGTDNLRARTEVGISLGLSGGTNVSADGFYDGIGAGDFEAYGISLGLRKSF